MKEVNPPQKEKFDALSDAHNRSHWKTLIELAKYLWPKKNINFRIRTTLAVIFLIIAKMLNVYAPMLYKDIIDRFDPTHGYLVLPLALIFSYALSRLATVFFGELRDFIFIKVAQRAKRLIALNTFEHLHLLPMRFHLERQTGGVTMVIDRGTRGIQFVLNFMVFNILPTLFELFLVTGILYYIFDFRFALITFFTIASYIAFTLIVTEWRLKYRRTMNRNDADANNKAVDSLINFETVKYFNNEQHEINRYDKALIGFERSAIKSQKSLSVLNIGQALIITLGSITILWLAGIGVIEKKISIGEFVLLNTYLIQLFLPLNFLGFVYREIKQSLTDMDKMFELLETKSEIEDVTTAADLNVKKGLIEFNIKNFSYDDTTKNSRKILNNVKFNVQPGQTVGIVGQTGSGKSTLMRLLFRFYDLPRAQKQTYINIDGVDIRDVTQNSLRKNIGIVPQDTVLFNDTIYYNIAYGNIDASEAEIIHAAKMAQVHDFITQLPEGYATKVGERGLKLSGGEKQRVAIARTILKNPPILLFDEATSALDSATEKDIQNALYEISTGKTTLVIAHRLSTIQQADHIIVMSEGKIVEQGTHKLLLKNKSTYANLWKKQQSERSKN